MEIREWIEEHGKIQTVHTVPTAVPRRIPSASRRFRVVGWHNVAIAADGTRRALSPEDEAILSAEP